MVAILHLADVVATRAAKALVADRHQRMDRTLPLSELVNLTVADDYKRRHVNRELEAIRDSVAKRLEKTLGSESSRFRPSCAIDRYGKRFPRIRAVV